MSSYLKQLKTTFQPYNLFWEEWKLQNDSGLTTTEIYVVEIHLKNNFIIEPEHNIMFYNQLKLIEEITKKLNSSYSKYQDWVMQKFIDKFIRLVGFPDFEIKCATPILLLNLPDGVKNKLALLKSESVLCFFEGDNKYKWRETENFKCLQSVVLALKENTVSTKIIKAKKKLTRL